jgi:uncharacterized membrane protein
MPVRIAKWLASRRVLLLLGLPGWCAMLLIARWVRAGHPAFRFLVWNLFLGAIPLMASGLLVRADRDRAPVALRGMWFAVWLLFLPNAPYIVSDFLHLHPRPPIALWFDITVIYSFAASGVVLCYASVADVHALFDRHWGRVAGWGLALGSLLLSGLGVYLGRFVRWNSWDAFIHPHRILRHVSSYSLDPSDHPRSIGVTLVYGVGLMLGYVVLRSVVPRSEGRERP